MKNDKAVVAEANKLKDSETGKLAALAGKKDQKFNEGKIDVNIKKNIENKLNQYALRIDSFGMAIAIVDKYTNYQPTYENYKPLVEKQLQYIKSYMATSNFRLRRFDMIDDGLNVAKQHVFNLAAFFGPGKYDIPKDKISIAETSFAPIIDSLVNFYDKYSDVDRNATLVILGFADGQGFNTQSDTYKELCRLLNQAHPEKRILNKKLSELRAGKMGDVMELSLQKRITNFLQKKNIDFIFIENGKGEEFPNANIRDYKKIDERRRIVLFFWNILPK